MHVDIVLQHLLTKTEHMCKKNQHIRPISMDTTTTKLVEEEDGTLSILDVTVTVCERKFNSVATSHKLPSISKPPILSLRRYRKDLHALFVLYMSRTIRRSV